MTSRLASMPSMQLSTKLWHASASSAQLSRTLCTMTGLKTLSSRWPLAAAKPTAASLPMTCTQTIVIASHCVGLTLPGMMLLPGSFSGRCSSPSPHRGPLPSRRTSLAILKHATASVLIAPLAATSASCPASAANLLGAVRERRARERGDLRAPRARPTSGAC